MTVLGISGLSKSFGQVRAVDGVSFDVDAGELVALVGPNGAGKTTCFNMLSGQLKPDAGKVTLNEHDITGFKPRDVWRRGVGRTFQITQTYGSMSVLQNVQMALISFHGKTLSFLSDSRKFYVEEAMHLLDRVGMASQAHRGCGVLAYGDLKRVELAVALTNRPQLLLMDEPTAGMAPKERIELMELTAEIVQERRVSVLFTEHDMDVVFTHAHSVIVLNRGRIIAQGSPEEVRNDANVRDVYLGTGLTFRSQ